MTNQDSSASNISSDLLNNSGFILNPLSEEPAVLPKTGGGETELGNYGNIGSSIPMGGGNIQLISSFNNLEFTGVGLIYSNTEENVSGKSISPGLAVENNILHTQTYQASRFPSLTISTSTISITANDSKAGEVIDGRRENPGRFTVTRQGDLSSSTTVNYTVTGTATNGVDYQNLNGQINFAAGVSRSFINLNVINDGIVEDTETVTLSLRNSSGYSLGTKTTATVNITDNDKPIISMRRLQIGILLSSVVTLFGYIPIQLSLFYLMSFDNPSL